MLNYYRSIIFLFIYSISNLGYSQNPPFEISLEPLNIAGLGGIQSYAFAQNNGKWLIIGGRLDGLHRRQPFAAFDLAGHNNQIIVIDPVSQQKWNAPLTSLPLPIQEQLSSTNMEFYQEGEYLYCIGGYGYSAIESDHTTFAQITAIKVPDLIDAVINNTGFANFFRQKTDLKFQVTGGRLKKIDDVFYLMGGQKFIGKYNPIGPQHGPGFIQEYSNSIRKFKIDDDGINLNINHLPSFTDSVNLHRRDYNAEAQILPNGQQGLTMFSGVFQSTVDLPFLNSVTIDSSTYTVNNNFQQHYNHYHCPVIPLYSESLNEMHSVFFGGLAQFYDSAGALVQDIRVPFVKTIARVTRDANGNMMEYKLSQTMPSLLGTGAEFIPNLSLAHFNNEVFKLDSLGTDSVLVGYIYGGISSTQANIFLINTGSQSDASSQIFKVYLKVPGLISNREEKSISQLNPVIYPNPSKGEFNISFALKEIKEVRIIIRDSKAVLIKDIHLKNTQIGENHYKTNIKGLKRGSVYFISIETPDQKLHQKLILD